MPIVQVHGTDALCNDIADLGPTRSSIVLSSGSGSAGRCTDDASFGGLDDISLHQNQSNSSTRLSFHHPPPDDMCSQLRNTTSRHQPASNTPIFIVDVPSAFDDSAPPPPRPPGRRRRHTMDHLNNNLDDDDMTVDTALMQPTAQHTALMDVDERSVFTNKKTTGLGTISNLASQFQTLHKSKQDYCDEIQQLQSKLDELQTAHRKTLEDNELLRRDISDLKQQAEVDAMKINVVLRERDELRTEVECLERDLERCKNRRGEDKGLLNRKRSFMTRMLSVQANQDRLDDVEEEDGDEYNVPIITQNKFSLRSVVKFDTVAIDASKKKAMEVVREVEVEKEPQVAEGRLNLRGFFNFGAGGQHPSDSTCSSTTEGEGAGMEDVKVDGGDRRMSRMMTVKFNLDEDEDEEKDSDEEEEEQPVPEETTAGAPVMGLWGIGQRLRFQQPQPQAQPQPQPQEDKVADPAEDNESEISQKPSIEDSSDVTPTRGIVGSLFRRQQQQPEKQPEAEDNDSAVSSKVSASSKVSTESSSSDVTPTRGIGSLFKRPSGKSQSVKPKTNSEVTPASSDDNVDDAVGSPETITTSEMEEPEASNDTEGHNNDSRAVETMPAANKLGITSLFRRPQAPPQEQSRAPPQDNTPQEEPPTTNEEVEADDTPIDQSPTTESSDDSPTDEPSSQPPPNEAQMTTTTPQHTNNIFSLRHLLRTPSQKPPPLPEETPPAENDTQLPTRRRQSGGIVQGLFRLRSSQRNANDNRDESSDVLSHRSSEFLTYDKEDAREDESDDPLMVGFPRVRVGRSFEEGGGSLEMPSPVMEERRSGESVEERPSMTSLQASSISESSRSFLSNEESHKCVPIGFY